MISIIIPTFNEQEHIATTLSAMSSFEDVEIIIVDGSSVDRTMNIVSRFPYVRFVISPQKGRAAQMHYGTTLAKGDIFWFVHADTIVTKKHLDLIHHSVSKRNAGGAFALRFRENGFLLRCNEVAARLRGQLFGIYYGDQAIFCSCKAYQKSGGFVGLSFMEDGFFSRRLSKTGATSFSFYAVETSARNILQGGTAKMLFIYWVISTLFLFGLSSGKLARIFKRLRG